MTFKNLFASLLVVATSVAPISSAYALELAQPAVNATTTVVATSTLSSEDTLAENKTEELALLKQKEQDPETGFFMKILIGLKIRQLGNQLNIKKALK